MKEIQLSRPNNKPVDLKCPSCGKGGKAMVIFPRVEAAPFATCSAGFYVKLGPKESLAIHCADCNECAYQLGTISA